MVREHIAKYSGILTQLMCLLLSTYSRPLQEDCL